MKVAIEAGMEVENPTMVDADLKHKQQLAQKQCNQDEKILLLLGGNLAILANSSDRVPAT